MAKTNLSDPIYHNEEAARAHFEAIRWPDGRVCPHCGVVGNSVLLQGESTRPGLYKCREKTCRKPFSAIMGTVYEKSHVPLHKWLLATHFMCASKKGVSAKQLERMMGFGSYRTAWFVAHRIREAMKSNDDTLMGTGGGVVEADEAFYGRVPGKSRFPGHNMNKIVALVDRATGRATTVVFTGASFSHRNIGPILDQHMSREGRLMTDQAHHYKTLGPRYASHDTVNHARGEYVNKDDATLHTNTIEGFFSIFKRGMIGTYQHCGSQHLHRYTAEFDFRYTHRIATGIDDVARAAIAVAGTVGRRLTYKKSHVAA